MTMRTMVLIACWKYGVRSFLQKSGTILYFLFFVESFVIGFAIVEIPSVVISKKRKELTLGKRLMGRRESRVWPLGQYRMVTTSAGCI